MTLVIIRNLEREISRKGTNPFEVARAANLNKTGVYDILKGKVTSPRVDTLLKVAKVLGVPLKSLFEEPGEDTLDRELSDTLGVLSLADRERLLLMARALRPQ